MISGSCEKNYHIIVCLMFFLVLLSIIASVLAEDTSYWVSASYLFGTMGKWDESMDAAGKAIALDPNYYIAWNNKASALSALKDGRKNLTKLKNRFQ